MAKRPYVRDIGPVPATSRIAKVPKQIGLENRRIANQHQLDRCLPHNNPPLSVAPFKAIDVATADEPGGDAIVVEQGDKNVAFAVRNLFINLAVVGGDVMLVAL